MAQRAVFMSNVIFRDLTKNYTLVLVSMRHSLTVWHKLVCTVPGASEFTGQSIGLPIALPGSGEAARGPSPFPSSSPGPGRAIGNPFDCPVNSEAPGTLEYLQRVVRVLWLAIAERKRGLASSQL